MFPTYYALFDVDETLISGKSLHLFADYCCKRLEDSENGPRRELLAELHTSAHSLGLDSTSATREYYRRLLEGAKVAEILRLGEEWFREAMASPDFFVPSALAHVRVHQSRGGKVVLLSESFIAPLAPIARYVGASHVFGTRLGVERGVFTGEVLDSCFEEEKSTVARRFLDKTGIDPSRCYAYGNHVSDLEMLASVGYPIVVGDDQRLINEANRRNWSTISSAPMLLE